MENIIKAGVVVYVALFLNVGAAAAGKDCTNTSTLLTHQGTNTAAVSDGGGPPDDGYCYHTPESLELVLYEFGVCMGAVSPATRPDKCSTLFKDSSGKTVNLAVGDSLPLSDSVTLDEGTYTHGYVLVGNVFKTKAIIEFTTDRTDDRGGVGKICYTDGRSVDNNVPVMSCGTDASAALPAPETSSVGDNSGSPYVSKVLGYSLVMAGETVVTDLYMATTAGVEAANQGEEAAFFGSQAFSAPVTINPNTTSLDISFVITNGVTLGFPNGAGRGPYDAVFEGLKFRITAN
ncbi:hypothetical protein N9X94_01720 [Planktomarina temperata]|nr:hypothetical protein [Planktomarina temperata]MDB2573424.1 hypothetical protein [Planktomarina temperata]